ncbi:MAG TPA: prepilin-type N-terminal cleavage/methylation domain-containing protein [Candidatus Saccharimonadales bacterium]|jgi:prepilin-type N-terminal cleavage/methylation domain-containing protein
MLHKLNKREKGFTIIEVLIVLAIAALILLIVFLAVPALQRSARNTTIKNDASTLAGGFSEYESNNGGAAPASPIAPSVGSVVIGGGNSVTATVKVNGSTSVTSAASRPAKAKASTLYWDTGKACDGTPSPSAIAVYYYIESSGGVSGTRQCVDG